MQPLPAGTDCQSACGLSDPVCWTHRHHSVAGDDGLASLRKDGNAHAAEDRHPLVPLLLALQEPVDPVRDSQ